MKRVLLFSLVAIFGIAILLAAFKTMAARPQHPSVPSAASRPDPTPPAHVPGMPKAIRVSDCVPAMGYHYADPKTLPFGPIYGWYGGRWVFTEIMPSLAMFKSGAAWSDELKPLPGYSINHVDFWFNPHGHDGYWVPHYDIHAFYVPHNDHMFWCGDKTGKRPYFYKGPNGKEEWKPWPS